MKKISLGILFLFGLNLLTFSQWQPCIGTSDLNMQSLLTHGKHNFAGGATGVYRSTNGAKSYVASNSGNDAVGPTRGFTKDNGYIYTCTSQGVFRSADNGSSWVSKNSGLTNLLTSGILNVGTRLFVIGPTGVFQSIDQAENWTSANLSTTDCRSIAAIKDTLFVGTNGSGIYKSVDWGANWVSINTGLGTSSNFRAIESKGNTLFAGGPIGTGVFRSLDFGKNWSLLSGGLTSGSYRGFACNNKLIVAGSFGGGVFYSKDNGNQWTAINTGLTDLTIFDLELNDSFIIAATNTKGVFRFALSNIDSTLGSIAPLLLNPCLIYPNPCAEIIKIKTDKRHLGSKYTVLDYSGKLIISGKIISEITPIETDQLANGIYFLKIEGIVCRTFRVVKK